MRNLTSQEIEKFSNCKGARKIAVENFLGTMGTDSNTARANLELDRGLYNWNLATVGAIYAGIKLAEREKK